jgi:hypothetical protein
MGSDGLELDILDMPKMDSTELDLQLLVSLVSVE